MVSTQPPGRCSFLPTPSRSCDDSNQVSALAEWLQRARQITWIYCPGHSGVVNEHADRLAGKTSEVSDRICLGLKDISTIIKNQHMIQDSEQECEREVGRMRALSLKPGRATRSRLSGRQRALACQTTLSDILRRRGAEVAWRRLGCPFACDASSRQ